MLRLTLGPRAHGDTRHIIVPSLILDADQQPGELNGGGSDYKVSRESIDKYEEVLANSGRDAYVSSNGENAFVVDESGIASKRPIFLSVFTTFHPNLNNIFAAAMNTRERLVVSILTYLRKHGHVVNTTNLEEYKGLFEQVDLITDSVSEVEVVEEAEGRISLDKAGPGNKHRVDNILVHVGDLQAKIPFPSRRTFHHVYRRSVFCPIPPGDVPHGSRFFHSVLSGCIPVTLLLTCNSFYYSSYNFCVMRTSCIFFVTYVCMTSYSGGADLQCICAGSDELAHGPRCSLPGLVPVYRQN
jgi:hypothetical protein